ncbi:efflux RND transporter periplasmic adaptor subunit [Planctomycetes bacterium K23_9]|uniref:Macrolide export protein MacA n=1 Tax=Stieleria marina TaxID=1930275 RepID=A0A517NVU1_9BACT|nr:Macrolide export protein MacA [Planctomycetes bacterium K23_9]
MNSSASWSFATRTADCRRGAITSPLALGIGVVLAMGLVGHFLVGGISNLLGGFMDETVELDVLMTQAVRAPFVHSVLERGEIQSSSNIEVRCQVRGRTSSSAVNILEIVPEGSWVEKGDFLVRLDDSQLQNQLIQQQIVSSNSEAAVIEAEATLDSARLALSEYDEGTFKEQLASQQSSVFVAEENKRRAQEYITYSKRLAERGYIPEAQLEADMFALEKAKQELGVAETKLEVLSKFTREKMLTQLKAAIRTATAKLQSRRKTLELDQKQLAEYEDQITKCMIHAPIAGQVVYANKRSRSSSSGVLIEEGMPVRERQAIIQLPDPKKMQVTAKVHESRIGFIKIGQTADLKLDAMPELPLTGTVIEVSEYPLPPISAYMSHVKEYEVMIEVDAPPSDLRPGMTAEVNLLVDAIDNALQVPIEAIVQRGEEFFCAVPLAAGGVETREVTVGIANETDLIIEDGLSDGESIVLNVTDPTVLELLELPEQE